MIGPSTTTETWKETPMTVIKFNYLIDQLKNQRKSRTNKYIEQPQRDLARALSDGKIFGSDDFEKWLVSSDWWPVFVSQEVYTTISELNKQDFDQFLAKTNYDDQQKNNRLESISKHIKEEYTSYINVKIWDKGYKGIKDNKGYITYRDGDKRCQTFKTQLQPIPGYDNLSYYRVKQQNQALWYGGDNIQLPPSRSTNKKTYYVRVRDNQWSETDGILEISGWTNNKQTLHYMTTSGLMTVNVGEIDPAASHPFM